MAKEYRLTPNRLAQERNYFTNLKNIQNYNSLNADYSVTAIQQVVDDLDRALVEETQLVARLAEVRNTIAAKGTAFTKKIDGAVHQIVAQFGDDSPEYQALGRRRRSDRRTGLTRAKVNGKTETKVE